MLGALAAAALIAAGSLAIGDAILALCERPRSWLAGPLGLSLLLALEATAASLGARGGVLAAGFVLLVATGAVVGGGMRSRSRLAGRRDEGGAAGGPGAPEGRFALVPPIAAAMLAAGFAALPFIAAGAVGILGVGLVNDDMASHLLIADWIDERFRPEPVFIDQGYPLGPHALVAGLATLLRASSIDVFAGLILALPALAALVAYEALGGLSRPARVAGAALVAVPYMAAAYLAQEAFKEPALALLVLAFALLLPRTRTARQAVPLGVLGAGAVYVYSFPGLAWLAGTAIAWAAFAAIAPRRRPAPAGGAEAPPMSPRARAAATGLALLALAILIAPELHRLADFTDFRALDPDRANEGGLGNLRDQLSPLTAFGIWPTAEFRLSAGAGSLPAALFYLCGLAGLFAFALALPRWARAHGGAIPAALASAALLYLAARAFGTVYSSAKALAIIAPLITLTTLGGLLGPSVKKSPRTVGFFPFAALGVAVALAGALSSFLILRQAPVAPSAHMDELAEIRPLVRGEKLLFLGRDNFILHELRGSKPFTAVKNYYDPYYARPNLELAEVFSKFDFDSVEASTLARFPYVLTTRAAYASGPPPGYEVAAETPTYVLWRRGESDPSARLPAESGAAPGAALRCRGSRPPRAGQVAVFERSPIVYQAERWTSATVKGEQLSSIALEVPRGSWELSLQYDATRPLQLSAGGGEGELEPSFAARLPGNLDYRGPGPFYPAGAIEGPVRTRLDAAVESPPLAGRLLGGEAVAHLGALALTPAGAGYPGATPPHPGSAARLTSASDACGEYADWIDPAPSGPGR